MAQAEFTKNYRDHSNDHGFQFEFFCDKCGSGHRSGFRTHKLGFLTTILRALGAFFGGQAWRAAAAGAHVKDAFRGKAWDSAYSEAIAAARPHFRQCTRCGDWVCPKVCWNETRELCEKCAPEEGEEAAVAEAEVAKERVWEKARKAPAKKERVTAACPHCGARVDGKFCSECGKPATAPATACPKCGAKVKVGVKFCSGCGAATTSTAKG